MRSQVFKSQVNLRLFVFELHTLKCLHLFSFSSHGQGYALSFSQSNKIWLWQIFAIGGSLCQRVLPFIKHKCLILLFHLNFLLRNGKPLYINIKKMLSKKYIYQKKTRNIDYIWPWCTTFLFKLHRTTIFKTIDLPKNLKIW